MQYKLKVAQSAAPNINIEADMFSGCCDNCTHHRECRYSVWTRSPTLIPMLQCIAIHYTRQNLTSCGEKKALFQLRGVARQSCCSHGDISCRSAFSLSHVMLHTWVPRNEHKSILQAELQYSKHSIKGQLEFYRVN